MAAADGLRAVLDRVAPPTSGRLATREVLLTGALAGAAGWTGTQLLAWLAPPASALFATGLWLVLIAGFAAVTLLHGPAELRFSPAMLGWGVANGTATVLTVGGLAGVVAPFVAFWQAWAGAAAVGYAWTAVSLRRAGHADRATAYEDTALVALAVLALGTVAFAAVEPVGFLALGAVHAVPLALDARGSPSGHLRGVVVAVATAAVLAVGLVG